MGTSHEERPASRVAPVRLGLDNAFRFRCRKGIACFNRCCENTRLLRTACDALRRVRRFGLTTRGFIDRHTAGAELCAGGE